ncbi:MULTISPECIES: NUDIX hydrolase [Streptomyces]|uniref:NUDIX domain-containing protein n=1 Tax=Streptomyces akebiae TaxID=2865673 RepID=A0ABX8XKU8_9ACTN|nr:MULTISPECIES: NUDIX domain-containing protein [Streptomyces]MCX5173404.1 NUDIX domain-containing protein [Streptomyces antibioticus]MCX5173965.1 NUDIX domain-containing protein [Streptomyces antibioticus]QYX76185.1 NUDIX domain-containing protein [Streptomyces akebiae]
MPPSPAHIRATAEAYLARHPGERQLLEPLFSTLAGVEDPTHRKTFPAHVTCSAIVLNDVGDVLHIRHNATGKALAPGGHPEPGDPDLVHAALRELSEETGIPRDAVHPLAGYETVPLDIDVHDIAANPAKGEPAHQHIDFRFVFLLQVQHAVILQTEEVSGYEWRPSEETASPTVRAKLALLPRSAHP